MNKKLPDEVAKARRGFDDMDESYPDVPNFEQKAQFYFKGLTNIKSQWEKLDAQAKLSCTESPLFPGQTVDAVF